MGERPLERPLARRGELVWTELDDETLVYDMVDQQAYGLNAEAARLLALCDGTRTIDELATALAVDPDVVRYGLSRLAQSNLLEELVAEGADGLTRRQLIKRLGLASAATLPVVAVFAAQPVAAASGPFVFCPPASQGNNVPSGCPCSINADCVPGCNCNPQGTATCCNAIVPNICLPPGSATGKSAAGCPCSINADCVPGCNCNPQGTATCCNV
jgi:hypothetical protein